MVCFLLNIYTIIYGVPSSPAFSYTPAMLRMGGDYLTWITLCNILKTGNVGGQSENKRVKSSLSTPWRHVQAEEVQLHTFLASALEGVQWSPARPLSTGKGFRYQLNTRMSESHRRPWQFWRKVNILPLPEFQPRTLQPVTGRYNWLR